MIDICKKEECTACNACVNACPHGCITMEVGKLNALYPVINQEKCVDCGMCYKTCPNNRRIVFKETKKIYAAWSNNTQTRLNSASGGICAELYKYYLSLGENGYAVGVVFNKKHEAVFCHITNYEQLKESQNSKYVYSNTNEIYKEIKYALIDNKKVLFIGLPCQVSGLYGYLKKDYPNLTTVDLVCHGVSPSDFLLQHLETIEKEYSKKTNTILFRDPKYNTYTYTFTLNDGEGEFYNCRVEENDVYQLGYHHALIYRDNCYSCKYAQRLRVGDITLCDFTGVGKKAPYKYDINNINCLLVNSVKGESLIKEIGDTITADERPFEEAYEYEQQLNKPYTPHESRKLFEDTFSATKDFDYAATCALKKELDLYQYKKTALYKISRFFQQMKRVVYKVICKLR